MSVNAKSPYRHTAVIEKGDRDVHDILISPRQAVLATPAAAPAVELFAGMACFTPQGHRVRIDDIPPHGDYANVYVISAPHIYGPMLLSELTPQPVKVLAGQRVRLTAGYDWPLFFGTVADVYGDYAGFALDAYQGRVHWAHTAHVLSVYR